MRKEIVNITDRQDDEGSKKFILVMGAELFNVSLRTFREDYIKGKLIANQS